MIFKIIVSVLMFLGAISNIFDIEKERKPLTATAVVIGLIINT